MNAFKVFRFRHYLILCRNEILNCRLSGNVVPEFHHGMNMVSLQNTFQSFIAFWHIFRENVNNDVDVLLAQ